MGLRIIKQHTAENQAALAEALRYQEQIMKVIAQRWSQMQLHGVDGEDFTKAFHDRLLQMKHILSSDVIAAETAAHTVEEWQKQDLHPFKNKMVNVKIALSLLD